MEKRLIGLLDKCEALSLLSSKATSHWSMIKFIFQIPLILTSSVMCILNSFERDGESNMKIPNVVLNGMSVLLLSLQSNLKVAEKVELFKNLSNQFLLLAHDIEGEDEEKIDREKINIFQEKYDALVQTCSFEDIPYNCKRSVIELFHDRSLPLQLNGASGIKLKRNSSNRQGIELSSQIV